MHLTPTGRFVFYMPYCDTRLPFNSIFIPISLFASHTVPCLSCSCLVIPRNQPDRFFSFSFYPLNLFSLRVFCIYQFFFSHVISFLVKCIFFPVCSQDLHIQLMILHAMLNLYAILLLLKPATAPLDSICTPKPVT
jgi:hypothetical protein